MLNVAALAALLVFLGLRAIRRHREKNTIRLQLVCQVADGSSFIFTQGYAMKKLSSSVSHCFITLAALTIAGLSAAVDGVITLVSSNPDVLLVTPQDDGTFRVDVKGIGLATLTASGDADLGDGVQPIQQAFNFEVYDGANELDHFDLAITGIVRNEDIAHTEADSTQAEETDPATA